MTTATDSPGQPAPFVPSSVLHAVVESLKKSERKTYTFETAKPQPLEPRAGGRIMNGPRSYDLSFGMVMSVLSRTADSAMRQLAKDVETVVLAKGATIAEHSQRNGSRGLEGFSFEYVLEGKRGFITVDSQQEILRLQVTLVCHEQKS